MIVACPRCEARYRVDEAKIGANGARLRCARCEAIFRVRAPAVSEPVVPAAAATTTTTPSAAPTRPAAAQTQETASASVDQQVGRGETSGTQQHYDRDRLVLVADPKPEVGKQTVSRLGEWGIQTILVHDGVEAMLAIQRFLPRVVVLDAALPKMYGFQICEVMKRNESLSSIKVVLVGAIHHNERYHRPPSDLYGADVYLEGPDLPEGLADALERFGLSAGLGGGPSVRCEVANQGEPTRSDVPSPEAATAVAPPAPNAQLPVSEVADDGLGEERAKAERLARIVVSDIVLYQGDKFDRAIREGNLLEALDSDIEEGRNFFRQRIDERVRSEKDYLVEELKKVARDRGAQ